VALHQLPQIVNCIPRLKGLASNSPGTIQKRGTTLLVILLVSNPWCYVAVSRLFCRAFDGGFLGGLFSDLLGWPPVAMGFQTPPAVQRAISGRSCAGGAVVFGDWMELWKVKRHRSKRAFVGYPGQCRDAVFYPIADA
jgi:hypothetical protein